jgi:hypothetical protein
VVGRVVIAALVLMCALSPRACHSDDAGAIARAVDAATDDDRLRAVLVVYAYAESRWRLHPRAESWDARAGLARGPWQLWGAVGGMPLEVQARAWLANVEGGGLAGVDSSPRRAARRAAYAAALLDRAERGCPARHEKYD